MRDKIEHSEPMSLSDVREILNGQQLDIPGMFEFARKQGVRVSDLSEKRSRCF